MNQSRRKFLTQSALTVAGLSLLKSKTFAAAYATGHIVGVQLYSVRDDMKTPQDALETLKKLSAAGYRYVEHANYGERKFYGYTAPEFKKILDDLNLKMRSGHTVLTAEHWDDSKNDFTDVWKNTVEDAADTDSKTLHSGGHAHRVCDIPYRPEAECRNRKPGHRYTAASNWKSSPGAFQRRDHCP